MSSEVRRGGPEATSADIGSATDRTSSEIDPNATAGLDQAIENASSDWWFQGAPWLRDIVREAIEQHVDGYALHQIERIEESERSLLFKLAGMSGVDG